MTTQTQIRRDTATNLNSATPSEGELAYDKTNKRLAVGDGFTAGGIRHASAKDTQNNTFKYSTVGGTANAITLTNSIPCTAYVAGQSFYFKAASTNTGAVTVNADTVGTRNIYKVYGNSVIALSGNEIISGGLYEIVFDGTQFQLASGGGGGIIGQQIFTESDTYEPSLGMRYCIVEAVGGGGGGGIGNGAGVGGSGGGGGEYIRSILTDSDVGASKTVTIGAGGAQLVAGGDTSLGSLVIAKGGGGGLSRSSSDVAGGDGGASGTGDIKIPGQKGGAGSSGNGTSGAGGNSLLGFGGAGVLTSNGGIAGTGYGSGGSGSMFTFGGGAGSAGIIIITEYR